MADGPSYAQYRRAVWQAFVSESTYAALGNTTEADLCRKLAVQIMATMPADDFKRLVDEITARKRVFAVKVKRP